MSPAGRAARIPERRALGVDVGAAVGLVGTLTKYLGLASLFPAAIAVGYGEPVWPFLLAGALTSGAGAAAERAGCLQVFYVSQVERIERDRVLLRRGDEHVILPNDAVIVSAGGILPSEFLQRVGIHVETKYGTA